eukprot:jgi/Tetstr1/450093/TSEL_037139.t2
MAEPVSAAMAEVAYGASELSFSTNSTQLLEEVCNNSRRQRVLLEGQLGKAGSLRRELNSFTSHVQEALQRMQSDPASSSMSHMMLDFRGDMERLLNCSTDTVEMGLRRSRQQQQQHSLSKENVDMQAFLSELQVIVAKAACEAEASKIHMAEAKAAHAKEVHRMQDCLHAVQSENAALVKARDQLLARPPDAEAQGAELVRAKRQVKQLQRALRESEAAAQAFKEEADRLRVEGEQMREEWRRATGSAVEGHAELARRCKAADAEAASLRSEFEAKVGVAEAALAKALEAAAEAGAAAAAMEEERDALVEELRHGAREGEVAQLRRQLQEAEAEAAEGGIAKEKLVEAAWRYREQAAALQAQMRQEVEMCKEEAAAAAERGVQEAELRMSAESQVELLQGEVERLAGELEDVTEQLSASNAELAGLRAQGDLTSQLSELRQLRLELDEKTEWLKTECEAQERSGSGDDVAAPGSPDASAEAPAPVVVYERTSLSRDLALSREKCLELGTALASKEAELARAWSEAQRAADIIAAVKEERHEVGRRLAASEARVAALQASYTAVEGRLAELLAGQEGKPSVREVHVRCTGARWAAADKSSPSVAAPCSEAPVSPSQSSMAAGHVDLRRSRSPPSSRGARAVQASSSASQDSAHVMLSEERVSVLLEGTEVPVEDRASDEADARASLNKQAHPGGVAVASPPGPSSSPNGSSCSISGGGRPGAWTATSAAAVHAALRTSQEHRASFPVASVPGRDVAEAGRASAEASPPGAGGDGRRGSLSSEIAALKSKVSGRGASAVAQNPSSKPKPPRRESPFKAVLDSIGRDSRKSALSGDAPAFSLSRR